MHDLFSTAVAETILEMNVARFGTTHRLALARSFAFGSKERQLF